MPVRQALNAVYAHIVRDMDGEQRKQFVDDLYGFTQMNRRADELLHDFRDVDGSLVDEQPAADNLM